MSEQSAGVENQSPQQVARRKRSNLLLAALLALLALGFFFSTWLIDFGSMQ